MDGGAAEVTWTSVLKLKQQSEQYTQLKNTSTLWSFCLWMCDSLVVPVNLCTKSNVGKMLLTTQPGDACTSLMGNQVSINISV